MVLTLRDVQMTTPATAMSGYCSARVQALGISLGCLRRRGHRGRHQTRWSGVFIAWPGPSRWGKSHDVREAYARIHTLTAALAHAAGLLEEISDLCDCPGPIDHDAGCHAVMARAAIDQTRGGGA